MGTMVASERDHRGTVRNTTKQYQTASSYNHMLQLQSHVIRSPECLSSVSDLRMHWICMRQLQTSNSCISTPIKNWTHVYM